MRQVCDAFHSLENKRQLCFRAFSARWMYSGIFIYFLLCRANDAAARAFLLQLCFRALTARARRPDGARARRLDIHWNVRSFSFM
jgi:hypothetical protein